MNIIIPMAGWGTRLRPHTLTVPKPLINVAGKSVVVRLIDEINASISEPLTNLVFIVKPQFGKEVEQMLLETGRKYNIPAHIVYQEEAMGTAHAVFQAKAFLEGKVFIAYADTLFKGKIIIPPRADSVIVVKKVDRPEQFGVVKMDKHGNIVHFVEKPREFVSDLAIVGIYYFKNGEILRDEITFLMDKGITKSGEYQLTDALTRMLNKGMVFVPASIEKWMDFGNKNAAIQTNKEILQWEFEHGKSLRGENIIMENVTVNEPCFIGNNVVLKNTEIGPYVSIGDRSIVENARIKNSLIGTHAEIKNTEISGSMLGNFVKINTRTPLPALDLGDYSKIGY